MSRLLSLEEEEFLEYLLKSFYRKEKSYVHGMINFDAFKPAVNLFVNYFENEDKLNTSNHSLIIKGLYIDDRITNKNCGPELGISVKTFYRYKQKYLQVFKTCLMQAIESLAQHSAEMLNALNISSIIT